MSYAYSMRRPTCRSCDENKHDECTGIARYLEQDGYNDYICQCYCRREINAARESKIKIDRFVALANRELSKDERRQVAERLLS